MSKPAHERTAAQKADHQRRIAKWYLQKERKTQAEIALELGIDQSTVSRDLAELKRRWQKQADREMGKAQGIKLQELELVKQEAWEAWFESKLNAETVTEKVLMGDPDKNRADGEDVPSVLIEKTTRVQGQTGNPKYLNVIQDAIAQESKILGLEKPNELLLKLPPEWVMMMKELGLTPDQIMAAIGRMLEKRASGGQ